MRYINWRLLFAKVIVTRTATRSCRTRKRAVHIYSSGVTVQALQCGPLLLLQLMLLLWGNIVTNEKSDTVAWCRMLSLIWVKVIITIGWETTEPQGMENMISTRKRRRTAFVAIRDPYPGLKNYANIWTLLQNAHLKCTPGPPFSDF